MIFLAAGLHLGDELGECRIIFESTRLQSPPVTRSHSRFRRGGRGFFHCQQGRSKGVKDFGYLFRFPGGELLSRSSFTGRFFSGGSHFKLIIATVLCSVKNIQPDIAFM